jgi:hypothetical protein
LNKFYNYLSATMSSPNFSSSSTDISSSSAPLTRADLVNRIEYLLSGGLQLGALVLLSLPLCGHFCRRQWLALKDGLAGSLLLYQLAQVGFLLPSLLYNCYMLWAWLCLGARFSVPTMFWLGLWSPAGMASISSATFFLTLDRQGKTSGKPLSFYNVENSFEDAACCFGPFPIQSAAVNTGPWPLVPP